MQLEAGSSAMTRSFGENVRDLVGLTKPRITMMVIITAAGGMWLAGGGLGYVKATITLMTIALVVAAANAFNCWMERDTDRLMKRTQTRPLPDGRMQPRTAMVFASIMGLIAIPTLFFAANMATAILGAVALVSYVAVYTPMKKRSPVALLVGAVPGAMPPLMGWTAVTGELSTGGLILFSILFLWQIPHFIGIATFRKAEYERAGLQVLPSVYGEAVAKRHAFVYALSTVACSLMLYTQHISGEIYAVTAVVTGFAFVAYCARGFFVKDIDKWARNIFKGSLVHLTALFFAIIIDRIVL